MRGITIARLLHPFFPLNIKLLLKTVCFPGQASFCMITIWLGFCPPLHTLFLMREILSSLHTIDLWYSKSSLQHNVHMLRLLFTAYLQIILHYIFAYYNAWLLQNVLIAQNAQVAASSVARRGLHVCTCVKRRRRLQVHICPPSVHTNTNTVHISIYSQKIQVKKYLLEWACGTFLIRLPTSLVFAYIQKIFTCLKIIQTDFALLSPPDH